MSNKHHYRKVFQSDHLGVPDLEEMIEDKKPLVFTITHVKQELKTKVAGRKIDANIAYFKENIKPMVLNATNCKVVKSLAGGSSFVEDWENVQIELYIDASVKMKGEIVGGLRIKKEAPIALTANQIQELQLTINQVGDLKSLTALYNSNVMYKTSPDAVGLFKERNRELTTELV